MRWCSESVILTTHFFQVSSKILSQIILDNIPEEEYISILCGIENTAEAIYKYQNSVLGLLDGIKNNYNQTEFDVEKLQEEWAEHQKEVLLKGLPEAYKAYNIFPFRG